MSHKYGLLVALLCLFASCECERYQCPGYSANPVPPGGIFRYRNAQTGTPLSIEVSSKDFSEPYGKNETVLAFSCQNDCMATASVEAATVTTAGAPPISLKLNMASYYEGRTYSNTQLHYLLNDMESAFTLQPELQAGHTGEDGSWYADTLREVNTGLKVYPRVLIQTRKTSGGGDAIVKTYWDTDGLVGFGLANGDTFWRE
ncbi:hypothetical protein [Taibaiella koreensis]|uniref:hypothetical protein n=1 Tax=Taibaiella koreensis TaxID=1268548 RepID=UPI000E59DCB4|nr:hypothetical protein [Taibaiella koreensis]